MNPDPCNCWDEQNAELKSRGYRIHTQHTEIIAARPNPGEIHLLFVQRDDGSKMSAGDQKTLRMTHCPFCGVKYPDR